MWSCDHLGSGMFNNLSSTYGLQWSACDFHCHKIEASQNDWTKVTEVMPSFMGRPCSADIRVGFAAKQGSDLVLRQYMLAALISQVVTTMAWCYTAVANHRQPSNVSTITPSQMTGQDPN